MEQDKDGNQKNRPPNPGLFRPPQTTQPLEGVSNPQPPLFGSNPNNPFQKTPHGVYQLPSFNPTPSGTTTNPVSSSAFNPSSSGMRQLNPTPFNPTFRGGSALNPTPSGSSMFTKYQPTFGTTQPTNPRFTSPNPTINQQPRQSPNEQNSPFSSFTSKVPNHPASGFGMSRQQLFGSGASDFAGKLPIGMNQAYNVANPLAISKATKRKSDTSGQVTLARRKRSLDEDSGISGKVPEDSTASNIQSNPTHKGLFQMPTDPPIEQTLQAKSEEKKTGVKISPRLLKGARLVGGIRRKSSSSSIIENPTSNQLVCTGIPIESNNRDQLRRHFSRFGNVLRVQPNPNKNAASVKFSTAEEAAKAKAKGKNYGKAQIHIYFMKQRSTTEDTEGAKQRSGLTRRFPAPQKPASTFQVQSLKTQKATIARTDADKLAVLERIDKSLRARLVKESDLSKVRVTIGTCPDMCPEKERYLRQHRNLLASYETEGSGSKIIDHQLAVKEYSRSSADQEEALPHELRPTEVLRLTMDFLLTHIMNNIDQDKVAEWYDFLWNRTRAMRKEISIQQSNDAYAVQVTEECARFHICCAHELCEEDRHNFDPKINNENLEKTMKTVLDMYNDVNHGDASRSQVNEPEFKAYYILLNINRTADVLREIQNMRTETRASPSVQVAVEAFSAVHSNNYARFFNVVKKATYLQAAILHRYFGQVRKQAIQTMARAYTTTKGTSIPLQDIIRTLQFSSITETNTFCAELMISTKPNFIELYRTESYEPEGSMSVFRSGLVSSKMADRSLGAIIAHGRAPSDQLHQPISSFDADGRYVGKHAALLDSPDVVEQPQRDSQDLSQEVISKLEAAGILNMIVKLVTKQLLLEITGEMVVQVSQEVIRATDLVKASTEVAHEVLQQHVGAEVMTICGEVIREELLSKQRHLELARQERERVARRVAEEEKRKREEESNKREQLERRMRERKLKEEKEKFLLEFSCKLSEEIQSSVVEQEILSISTTQYKEAQLDRMSTEFTDQLIENTVQSEVTVLADSVVKLERKTLHNRLSAQVEGNTLNNLWKRWKAMLGLLRKRRHARMMFPAAPAMRTMHEQVTGLLPGPGKSRRNSFPLCGKQGVTFSVEPLPGLYQAHRRLYKELDTQAASSCKKMKKAYDSTLNVLEILFNSTKQQESLDFKATHIFWRVDVIQRPNSLKMLGWVKKKLGFKNVDDNEVLLHDRFHMEEHNRPVFGCCQVKAVDADQLKLSSLGGAIIIIISSHECFTYYKEKLRSLFPRSTEEPQNFLLVINCWNSFSKQQVESGLNLNDLPVQYHVINFKDMDYISNEQQLIRGIEISYQSILPTALTCASLREVMEEQISLRYIKPVMRHCGLREQLSMPTLEPHHLVEIYNNAIQFTCNVLTNEDLSSVTWPSPEIISTNMPSKDWNSAIQLEKLKLLCSKLQLPDFPHFNKHATESEVRQKLSVYCQSACHGDEALHTATIATVRLFSHHFHYNSNLDLTTLEEKTFVEKFPWSKIVEAVASTKLQELIYSTRDQVVCYDPYKMHTPSLPHHISSILDEIEFNAVEYNDVDDCIEDRNEVEDYSTVHSLTMGAASNLSTILSQTAMMDSNASENSWLFENPTSQTKLMKVEVENEKILNQRFEEKLRNLLENPANSSFDYFDALF